jgi:ABC-type branched-subunit amino acid transport system ATPase component
MMLEVDRLTAGYGRVQVLHDVSLTVDKAEIVALVGPNGAGKSTLLRAITAMIPDRSGSVTVDGRELIDAGVETIAGTGVATRTSTRCWSCSRSWADGSTRSPGACPAANSRCAPSRGR